MIAKTLNYLLLLIILIPSCVSNIDKTSNNELNHYIELYENQKEIIHQTYYAPKTINQKTYIFKDTYEDGRIEHFYIQYEFIDYKLHIYDFDNNKKMLAHKILQINPENIHIEKLVLFSYTNTDKMLELHQG